MARSKYKIKSEHIGSRLVVGSRVYMIPTELDSRLLAILKEFAPHILEENVQKPKKKEATGSTDQADD